MGNEGQSICRCQQNVQNPYFLRKIYKGVLTDKEQKTSFSVKNMMYSIGQNYKFQVKGANNSLIYYTGTVVGEDENLLKLQTFRDEEIVINKKDISQSKRLKNSTGEKDGHKKSHYSEY